MPGRGRVALLAVSAAIAGACGRVGYDTLDPIDPFADAGMTLDADRADVPSAVDAGADATPLVAPDYCAVVPRLAAAPVIDGVLEPGVALRELVPLGWIGPGSAPPAGQRADYAVAWRPDGLYVFVAVVDPTRLPAVPGDYHWCGDGIETYVDSDGLYPDAPDYDDPGTRQLITGAPVDDVSPATTGEAWCIGCPGNFPASYDGAFVTIPTPGGYALEALVTAGDLELATWAPSAGDTVGLDLAINVSGDGPTGADCGLGSGSGLRVGEYFLHLAETTPREPFSNVTALCTATLLD